MNQFVVSVYSISKNAIGLTRTIDLSKPKQTQATDLFQNYKIF